jgi:hypothetical protein
MVGMVSLQFLSLDQSQLLALHSPHTPESWLSGLIVQLLEATHGQWIYRNLTVHDHISGLVVTKSKEQLQLEMV